MLHAAASEALLGTPLMHGAIPSSHRRLALPKPPNYKQDKKRREEMQKRKNQEEQLRKAARKNKLPDGQT